MTLCPRLAGTLVVLLFASTASAQQTSPVFGAPPGASGATPAPARDSPRRTAGTSAIRGRITAVDGLPLAHAIVRIYASELAVTRTTLTDADGRYELRDLAAGRYSLSASKTGLLAASYGQNRPGELPKPLDLPENETIERLDLRLTRAGVISGRVVDEFGEPMVSVSVQALQVRTINGERRPIPIYAPFTTPDTGEFRLWDLAPGEYYVLVNVRTMRGSREPDDSGSGYIPTYYPGTANVAEAQTIRVGRGETANGIEVTLTPSRVARITGSVIDTRGQMVRTGNINVINRTNVAFGGMASNGVIGADGTFSISGLAPGDYELRTSSRPVTPAGAPETMAATVTIVRDDVSGVLLTPIVPVRISGRITLDPPSQTLEPAMIRVTAYPSGPQRQFFGGIGGPPVVNDDFTFELSSSPGTVAITAVVSNATGWNVRTVRVGGVEVPSRVVDLASGRDLDDVEIVLTNRVQTVTGTIVNSRTEAITDARVIAFPQDRTMWEGPPPPMTTGQARPDQNGRYVLRSLRPGDYFVVAVPFSSEPIPAPGGEYYEQLSLTATRVTIRESETKVIDLRLTVPR